ncbi:MAG: hypothetical protein JO247_06830 [Chloroflexi bacterium]|nr:hypothetical protein [Chloroflexota bacterium]
MRHADIKDCQTCHADIYNLKMSSKHKTVNCEICHGVLAEHVKDPTAVKPFKPKDGTRCLLCHKQNVARPHSFPQIDPASHAGGTDCLTCHRPHHPELGEPRSNKA